MSVYESVVSGSRWRSATDQPPFDIAPDIETDRRGEAGGEDFLDRHHAMEHREIGGDRRGEGGQRKDENEDLAQDHRMNSTRLHLSPSNE